MFTWRMAWDPWTIGRSSCIFVDSVRYVS
jgi:hypothetical protein